MTRVVITGGAGFIGCNIAHRWVTDGATVCVFDNLTRRGAGTNAAWLKSLHGDRVQIARGDIRDVRALGEAVRGASLIFHMASQVAVTLSVKNPVDDFEINALGTLNVLEAARKYAPEAPFIYASTNKVYGELESCRVQKVGRRYQAENCPRGISEEQPLDFHSPYGCSKGAGDQYVRDYARVYGLPTVVFRQSCIYGPRQFGHEDQGWVAHFLIAAMAGEPITIYGDGCQVRDLLYIEDLLDAYGAAVDRIETAKGRIYNIGGGPDNTVSVNEVIEQIGSMSGARLKITHGPWRPGDQRFYVSDIRAAARDLGWRPRVSPYEGMRRLHESLRENASIFAPKPVRSSIAEMNRT